VWAESPANTSDRFAHRESGHPACFAIRFCVGCALNIPMIIQTIVLDPSGAVWTDDAPNLSRPDPTGTDQIDAEHQATELAVK
jgi:hypothetical protein